MSILDNQVFHIPNIEGHDFHSVEYGHDFHSVYEHCPFPRTTREFML